MERESSAHGLKYYYSFLEHMGWLCKSFFLHAIIPRNPRDVSGVGATLYYFVTLSKFLILHCINI